MTLTSLFLILAAIASAPHETAQPPDPAVQFARALEGRQFEEARRHAEGVLDRATDRPAALDELSYRLAESGAPVQAVRLLLKAYPFAGSAAPTRLRLVQRVAMLVPPQRTAFTESELAPLRAPLDAAPLRSQQAVLWELLNDCAAVRAVLGDLSPEYGYDDWLRLGDCSAGQPAVARQMYLRAHALHPGGRASRALALQAHADGEYAVALDTWQTVPAADLTDLDLLGASTTALAAGDMHRANSWLDAYSARGGPADHRYWSLLARTRLNTDPEAAAAALERAVALHEDVDDLLRLAGLQRDAAARVRWLERARTLAAGNVHVQAALGYAYLDAGRRRRAIEAFEHAARFDPDNVAVQLELGYGYWEIGEPAKAQRAFERAWQTDPGNLAAAQQLVYVHQRLHHNEQARWYARQVLDALPASSDDDAELANRRFGLRRLHEELGRRLTINLDGFSGTRVGAGGDPSLAARGYRSYSQLEVDYRLGRPSVRNGKTISAYARVIADGGHARRPVPSENAMLGAGARWKPWRSQVLYLAAEHQQSMERRGDRDIMVRASASFLNGGRYSDDWHAAGSGWFAHNIYLDAARFVDDRRSAFTADYRSSYHRKIGPTTVEPYAHLQTSVTEYRGTSRDIRAGAGLRWNLWYGGSRYSANPHKLSIGLELQRALETYMPDRQGLFLSVGSRW